MTKEIASELDLREDGVCDRAALQRAAERSERILAHERAIALLARREHSRKQLSDKLLSRGFSTGHISAVLDELEGDGSLSDLRFAEEWLESRLRNAPRGDTAIRAALRERGVGREEIEAALQRVSEREPELMETAASRALARLARTDRDPVSLKRKLMRRGFSHAQIRAALSELEAPDLGGTKNQTDLQD